jgi:hypothetical protein
MSSKHVKLCRLFSKPPSPVSLAPGPNTAGGARVPAACCHCASCNPLLAATFLCPSPVRAVTVADDRAKLTISDQPRVGRRSGVHQTLAAFWLHNRIQPTAMCYNNTTRSVHAHPISQPPANSAQYYPRPHTLNSHREKSCEIAWIIPSAMVARTAAEDKE